MNKFFWIQIFTVVLSILLWFVWLKQTVPGKWFVIGLILQVISFLIYALPDPTDSQDGKDAGNWRVPVGVGLALAGLILPVIVFEVLQSQIL